MNYDFQMKRKWIRIGAVGKITRLTQSEIGQNIRFIRTSLSLNIAQQPRYNISLRIMTGHEI